MSKEGVEEFMRNTAPIKAGNENFSSDLSSENRGVTEKIPKNKENDPTALDVILGLINEDDESKASEYMKGHIS